MKRIILSVVALMMTVGLSAQFYIYLSDGRVLQADSISVVSPVDGFLTGKFSVSADQQVQFSKGNLQYVGTWQFAQNQWEYFGNNQSDNHRDLFSWGTGTNPNSTSTDDLSYRNFSEWGANAITNGGNQANLWRTLTNNEWGYLLNSRANASSLFGLGSVNGVNGLIILPDNWINPLGIPFVAGAQQSNSSGDNFTHNTFTVEQWSVMEAAGAVFLPSAGWRNGTNAQSVGEVGYYWSATQYVLTNSYRLYFDAFSFVPQTDSNKSCGYSVRLVR